MKSLYLLSILVLLSFIGVPAALSAQKKVPRLYEGLAQRKACKSFPEKGFGYALLLPPHEGYMAEYNPSAAYELQLHCLSYAYNASRYMYDRFGSWNAETTVAADTPRKAFIWWDVALLGDPARRFHVFTYGEESEVMFTAFRVFDQVGNDCLAPVHPDSRALILKLTKEMKKLAPSEAFLSAFQGSGRIP